MSATAKKTDPDLWDRIKAEVEAGDKGGTAGEWSARKAQLAVSEYKKAGGGYAGGKDPHNHLAEWSDQDWGTKSGKPSGETHERYLPRAARDALTDEEYRRSTAKKRRDTAGGHQYSAQPADVAAKAAWYRGGGGEPTKAGLLRQARARGLPGRSRMTKAQLAQALG